MASWLPRSKKRRKTDSTRPPGECLLDYTVAQLRHHLIQAGVECKHLRLKSELLLTAQRAQQESLDLQRDQRIRALVCSSASDSMPSPVASLVRNGGANRALTVLSLHGDSIIAISQYLHLSRLVSLANTCRRMNGLVSMKLTGHPSPALAQRQVLVGAEGLLPLGLNHAVLTRLILSMPRLQTVHVALRRTRAELAVQQLIRTTGASLRSLRLQPRLWDKKLLGALTQACPNLNDLSLSLSHFEFDEPALPTKVLTLHLSFGGNFGTNLPSRIDLIRLLKHFPLVRNLRVCLVDVSRGCLVFSSASSLV